MKNYKEILKHYWGYDDFRGIQQEIIESIGSGHDTLGLMPTGGGKSITFQVPALAQEGVCIVITPLIALMKDQVRNLKSRGIKAAAVHSGLRHEEIVQILENAIFGGVKILYVSPERLDSEIFRTKLRHMNVCFICVDEAHCISQWGYDFRPSYLEIADIRRDIPHAPVLALTATATPQVADDIQEKLSFKEKNVFRMSFERKNLAYIVRPAEDKCQQLIHILENVPGSAIVYARSRQRTKEFAEQLQHAGISATFFHAGLEDAEKDKRQNDWLQGKARVIVATNAFGMGIDKPDVRIVAHVDCPSSIEAYFQEAGRAGRDGNKAYAVLLYNHGDDYKLRKRVRDTYPDKDFIRIVYDHLAYFFEVGVGSGYQATFEFSLDTFCHNYRFFPIQVDAALKILHRAGYIEYYEDQDNKARLMFILERDDLYRLKGNGDIEDKVIVSLLRNYSGLFCDFAYIDEALLSQETELPRPVVYQALKSLAQKRIVNYIPPKRSSLIRYTQRREESKYLIFPKNIYEDLKKRYEEKIEAVINYASTDNQCRSRQLLRYFGEKRNHDCGQCDICLDRSHAFVTREKWDDAKGQIINLLNDKRTHSITELHKLPLPYETMEPVLQWLIDERIIIDDDGYLFLGD